MVKMVQGEVHPNLKARGKDKGKDQMVRDWDHEDQEEDQESQVMDQSVVDAEIEVVVHVEVLDHVENAIHQRTLNKRCGLFLHFSNLVMAEFLNIGTTQWIKKNSYTVMSHTTSQTQLIG